MALFGNPALHPKVVLVPRVTPLEPAPEADKVQNVPEPVDARSDRLAQSLVGVFLLAGFVFRIPWVLPVMAAVLGIGAVLGPGRNPIHWAFGRYAAPRLEPMIVTVDAEAIRASDIAGASLLALGSLLWLAGIGTLGWLLALLVAVAAIVAATTRIHLAERILRRRH